MSLTHMTMVLKVVPFVSFSLMQTREKDVFLEINSISVTFAFHMHQSLTNFRT